MKKILILISVLGLMACEQMEKMDKQLYDSTEANVPITKLDQLEAIDKLDAEASKDTTAKVEPK